MPLQANALLSVDEVFAYLRLATPVNTDSLYLLVESLINRASDECESYISGPIVNRTITESLDGSGTDLQLVSNFPIQSVTSVSIDGVDQTANIDFYDHGTLFLTDGGSFSCARKNVEITYVAGYGATKDTIPQNLKQACLLITQFWFKRDSLDYSQTFGESDVIIGESAGVNRFPYTALKMLSPYRKLMV